MPQEFHLTELLFLDQLSTVSNLSLPEFYFKILFYIQYFTDLILLIPSIRLKVITGFRSE